MAALLPSEAATTVWERLAPMRVRYPAVRWLDAELLHLTLVFMGDIDASRVAELERGLVAVAHRHPAYTTRVGGAGGHIDTRRSGRGGVAWLTLRDGALETAELALDVDTTLGTRTYDERRRPRSHLTVARAVDVVSLAALRDVSGDLDCAWRTTTLVLFRSYLGPTGSRYERVAELDLAAGAPT